MTETPNPQAAEAAGADRLAVLAERVKAARECAERTAKALKPVEKTLRELSRKETLDDAAALAKLTQTLRKAALPEGELKGRVDAMLTAVDGHLAEEERRLKFYFGRDLRDAATQAGLAFSPLTTDPPEFRLGLFTVAIDMPRRAATLRYARVDLEKTPLNAGVIVEAAAAQAKRLEGRDFDAARFFDQLLQAYQIRLHRRGEPFGSRVDIVELLAELAFVRQGEAFFEDPRRENFTPYSRVQLAYDLARLRRAGKLSHRGFRLGLGAATGGSTRQKSAVLYLEDERGTGQWYLSLKFSREGDEG